MGGSLCLAWTPRFLLFSDGVIPPLDICRLSFVLDELMNGRKGWGLAISSEV